MTQEFRRAYFIEDVDPIVSGDPFRSPVPIGDPPIMVYDIDSVVQMLQQRFVRYVLQHHGTSPGVPAFLTIDYTIFSKV